MHTPCPEAGSGWEQGAGLPHWCQKRPRTPAKKMARTNNNQIAAIAHCVFEQGADLPRWYRKQSDCSYCPQRHRGAGFKIAHLKAALTKAIPFRRRVHTPNRRASVAVAVSLLLASACHSSRLDKQRFGVTSTFIQELIRHHMTMTVP